MMDELENNISQEQIVWARVECLRLALRMKPKAPTHEIISQALEFECYVMGPEAGASESFH